MPHRLVPALLSLGAAAVLAATLAGCTSSGSATASASPSAAPATSAPADASGGGPGTTPPPTGSQTPAPEGTCATDDLDVAVVDGGGGAAGSVDLAVQFTNTSDAECTLDGPPGVSLVGDGNGTQLGAAATWTGTGSPVTIAAGGSAYAPLKVVNAENYADAECVPVAADGYRVYPPHSYTSVFVEATGVIGCSDADAGLLSVGPVQSERP